MARILIAAAPDEMTHMELILGPLHETVCVATMARAMTVLKEDRFDLILVCVHFDESRMFELLTECKKLLGNASKPPVICFCTQDTPLSRAMHQSIVVATKVLGAWGYLDQHDYPNNKDSDSEIRLVIESCLVGTACTKTQEKRVGIQKRREELLRLRQTLAAEEWSEDVEARIVELRQKVSELLLELSKMRVDNTTQKEKLASARCRQDHVPEQVRTAEQGMAQEDKKQGAVEGEQLDKELEQFAKEDARAKKGRKISSANKLKKDSN